jgi:hypothetical protein
MSSNALLQQQRHEVFPLRYRGCGGVPAASIGGIGTQMRPTNPSVCVITN